MNNFSAISMPEQVIFWWNDDDDDDDHFVLDQYAELNL